MKKLLALLLSTAACFGATVTGPIGDLSGGAFNPRVEFWPLSTPLNSGSTNIVGPMKSVAVVSGNFSQVFVAGSYLVKFPPTTNSFTIHVPNDAGTYSLAALSTNVSSVTGVATTPAYKVKVSSADTNADYLSSSIVAGSNITITTNNAGADETLTITASGGSGDVTQSGLAAGSYAINGVLATNLNYSALNIGRQVPQNVNNGLKRVSTALAQGRPLRILELGDDAVGSEFDGHLITSLTNFLITQVAPFYGNGSYMYRNAIGGATDNSSTASASLGLWPGNTLTMPTGSSSTNISTSVSGWPTTRVTLSYYQGSGHGTLTVRTQTFGGTWGTLASVDANGGTFQAAFTNWDITLNSALVASVYSSGTNIVVGVGQYNTNLVSGFSLDSYATGNAQLTNYAAVGGVMSNASRIYFASNSWDLIVPHFLDGSSAALTSNEWRISAAAFESMLSNIGCMSDVLYVAPAPSFNGVDGFSENLRDGMRQHAILYGRGMFDSTSYFSDTNTARLNGYYQSDGLHLSTTGGVYLASRLLKDFGLTADNALSYGIKLPSQRTNATDYTSLRVQSGNTTSIFTNGFGSLSRHVWGYTATDPADYSLGVGSGLAVIRGTTATYLLGANKGDGFGGQYGFFSGGTSGGGLLLHPSGGGGINNNEPGPGGISMHGGLTNYNTSVTKTHFLGGVTVGSTPVTISTGSGTPEGVVTAPVGSLFLRNDGSTSTTLYVKTSGTGNTGWTAK